MGYAATTLRAESISQPRYEGLLAYAPSVVGNAEDIAVNYEEYVANLQKFVTNISEFYALAMDMPQLGIQDDSIRVLHVSDIHLNPSAWHLMESVVEQFDIDAVADTGDMNDWGSEQEAEIFSQGVEQVNVPYVFVKGNHDSVTTVAALASYDNVIVLDGEVREIAGLEFAGIGDPRFTPDKGDQPSSEYAQQMLTLSGERLQQAIEDAGGADLAMVHEPPMADPLTGEVPLVLAGHTHERRGGGPRRGHHAHGRGLHGRGRTAELPVRGPDEDGDGRPLLRPDHEGAHRVRLDLGRRRGRDGRDPRPHGDPDRGPGQRGRHPERHGIGCAAAGLRPLPDRVPS